MKKLINKVDNIVDEMLDGMTAAYPQYVKRLEGFNVLVRAKGATPKVALVSGDRDLLQIASDHVKIRIPKTKMGRTEIEDYYAADVKAKLQVTPAQFIELKALM
ncbi:MAG: hypothetical protein IJG39_11335, partial [Synergistaceae bacterium]|nr:hypothetical protein [Synergistaceae bacterium]